MSPLTPPPPTVRLPPSLPAPLAGRRQDCAVCWDLPSLSRVCGVERSPSARGPLGEGRTGRMVSGTMGLMGPPLGFCVSECTSFSVSPP